MPFVENALLFAKDNEEFLSLSLTVLQLATVCAGNQLQYLGFQHWKVNRLYKSVVTGNVKFKRAVEEILRQP